MDEANWSGSSVTDYHVWLTIHHPNGDIQIEANANGDGMVTTNMPQLAQNYFSYHHGNFPLALIPSNTNEIFVPPEKLDAFLSAVTNGISFSGLCDDYARELLQSALPPNFRTMP